ncbi:hypothetical protein [Melittangium boletus]|uniref:hypothetical protein n=1 Tax=Melittangium boletus TaxID=83453 RepID=UPI003DA33F56
MARNDKNARRGGTPPFEKDRVDRGQEADDTRPLYAAEAIHSTEEAKFSFDSDGPVGGPVSHITSPIEESDEYDRQGLGRTESEQDADPQEGP